MINRFQSISPYNIPLFDYHMHTNWTDGKNTIKEMALALNRTYGGVNGALTRFNLRA